MNPVLSAVKKKADVLMRRYDQLIRLIDTDDVDEARDESVTQALAFAYPERSEDAQADMFGCIRHVFDEYPAGVQRRMALHTELRKYELGRIYPGSN